jgi:hypothetical protein
MAQSYVRSRSPTYPMVFRGQYSQNKLMATRLDVTLLLQAHSQHMNGGKLDGKEMGLPEG